MLQFIFLLFTVHLSPPDKWITYTDSLGRYSIQYPTTWEKKYVQNAVGFLCPKQNNTIAEGQENVNVMLQDLSAQPMSLLQYNDLTRRQYTQGYGSTSILSMKDTVFNGNPAEVGIFQIPFNGQPIKLEQCWFIIQNTAYLLTYTAEPSKFESYRHTAEKIIRSLKISQKGKK